MITVQDRYSMNNGDHEALIRDEESGFIQKLYMFLEGRTTAGAYFVAFIVGLIVIITIESILSTVDSLTAHPKVHTAFSWLEGVVVVIFTIEYVARFVAASANPQYASTAAYSPLLARFRHLISFYALVDLLAILPWYLAVSGVHVADEADELLRMLRLLRLLALDRYVPSVTLLDDVIRKQAHGLVVAGFATIVLWITFATLLYITEHGNTEDFGDDHPMSQRFENVPNAMQYTLILLTGDYPMINFSIWGKVVNSLMIIAAVGVVGVPAGLICSGFTDIVEEQKRENAAHQQAVAKEPKAPAAGPLTAQQENIRDFLHGETRYGKVSCFALDI